MRSLIRDERAIKNRKTVVDCFYDIEGKDDNVLFHICNSSEAQNSPEHHTQVMTFHKESIKQLRDILNDHFGDL